MTNGKKSKIRLASLLVAVAVSCCICFSAFAQSAAGASANEVGIDEKLGGSVALDAVFLGEDASPVTLRQLVRTPTILALVYYNCPNVCDLLLTGLAGALNGVTAEPGRDFNVVTISIDDRETPADARRAKRIGLESIQKPFPPESWRFLTGTAASIDEVANSVGFRFARRGDYFDHPVGIIILSPTGKIIRYMNGADFLPADLKLSLLEASRGIVGPTIAKFFRVCFSYDPSSHQLVFNTLRVLAVATLAVAGALVAYIVLGGRKKRGRSSTAAKSRPL